MTFPTTEHPADTLKRDRLFTFTNKDRRTRVEMNQTFYGRCWQCGHRGGHHIDTVWTSKCTLGDCPCYIGPTEPKRA